MDVLGWDLDILRKYGLYNNLKKCRLDKDEVRFLGYIRSAQKVQMKEKRIEAVKNWPEPKSVQDIQVFIGFANFYWCFIQGFSRIATLLNSMLKTLADQPHTTANKLNNGGGSVGGADVNSFGFGLNEKSSKSKNKKLAKSRKSSGNSSATVEYKFLTSDTKEAFNLLRQAFIKAPIL